MMSKAILKRSKIEIAKQVKLADSFFDRLIGLMFQESMNGFDGLLITKCKSIHTCFMRYSLDILFLDEENKIVKIFRHIKPWRFTLLYFSASKVLELNGGQLMDDILVGDEVEFINV